MPGRRSRATAADRVRSSGLFGVSSPPWLGLFSNQLGDTSGVGFEYPCAMLRTKIELPLLTTQSDARRSVVGPYSLGGEVTPITQCHTFGPTLGGFDVERWTIETELKCEQVNSLRATARKVGERASKAELPKHGHGDALEGSTHLLGSVGRHDARDT